MRGQQSAIDPHTNQQLSVKVLLQIDSLCDRFEDGLKAGRGVSLDDCLQGLDGVSRQLALRELLALEIGYRLRAGEQPRPEEYVRRFPDDRDVGALALADADEAAEKSPGSCAQTQTFKFAPPTQLPHSPAVVRSPARRPRSVSLGQVTRWLVESDLMTAAEIDAFLQALPAEKHDGKRAIEEMYRQGKLTKFQARPCFRARRVGWWWAATLSSTGWAAAAWATSTRPAIAP
jgi:hypothetical protein